MNKTELTYKIGSLNDKFPLNLPVAYINSFPKGTTSSFVKIGKTTLRLENSSACPQNEILMSKSLQKFFCTETGDSISVTFSESDEFQPLDCVKFICDLFESTQKDIHEPVKKVDLLEGLKCHYNKNLVFGQFQPTIFPYNEGNLELEIEVDEENKNLNSLKIFDKEITKVQLIWKCQSVQLIEKELPLDFKGLFNEDGEIRDEELKKLGIGGVRNQLDEIFTRVFASRTSNDFSLYGVNHVKGILLHGPPGTGKTMIARMFSKLLTHIKPKIVNGPELFDKYVGETEKKIRELFSEAIHDEKLYKEDSPLHILIFDEIDSMCRKRGNRDGHVANDTAVNQLLCMIDGVEALNNVLLIGMTNRIDLIDDALKRPGRFEITIEIPLPDEQGREEILKIYMEKNKRLAHDIDIKKIARLTKNFTGAELVEIFNIAASQAMKRSMLSKDSGKVHMKDFEESISKISPAFGQNLNQYKFIEKSTVSLSLRNSYNNNLSEVNEHAMSLKQPKNLENKVFTILLEGPKGPEKLKFAFEIAKQLDFPFMKLISAQNLIAIEDNEKNNVLISTFLDAQKSSEALIIIDGIEIIISYIRSGLQDSQFSNRIFQTLKTMLTYSVCCEKKIVVVATIGESVPFITEIFDKKYNFMPELVDMQQI
jgi:SpoVK/Ycf46/Vps4 family AAA+-type ATPase